MSVRSTIHPLMVAVLLVGTSPAYVQPIAPEPADEAAAGKVLRTKESNGPSSPADGAQTGNPLWAIPLATLNATRERPIFSPSRRPPPVASAPANNPVVRVPTKSREPERPQLALVGTIIGQKGGFGLFVDDTTKGVVRMRTGDSYHGWILRALHGRDATLEKDEQTTTLSLPRPADDIMKGVSRRP